MKMELFDKLKNAFSKTEKSENTAETFQTNKAVTELLFADTFQEVEEEIYGLNDRNYMMKWKMNDSFKWTKSHSEIHPLYTYNPNGEYGIEGETPCLCIDSEDCFYDAIDAYVTEGSTEELTDFEKLSGSYLFKAKIPYYDDDVAYFYAIDSEIFDKAGFCMIYPKEYVGTVTEKKLMSIMDEAACSMTLTEE